MPRGIPNNKPISPAPLLLIEPEPNGSIRFNAYGLEHTEVIDLLRRTLLHLVATQNGGVQVISLEVPSQAAVVAARRPSKPRAALPGPNGRRPARLMARAALEDMDGDLDSD